MSWWGYFQRTKEIRLVRIIWEVRTEINKKRGNPRQKLYKAIARILERIEITWDDTKKLGENKKG